MIKKGLILILCISSLSGCASIPKFKPTSGFDNIDIKQGTEVATIKKITSQIMVSIEKNKEGYLEILLLVSNISNQKFNFFPEDVKLYKLSKAKKKELKVYTPEQWMKKKKNEQAWAMVAKAFGDGMSSASAANSYTYKSDGTYAYTYDQGKQNMMNSLHNQENIQIVDNFEKQNNQYDNTMLKANTISPGNYVIGRIFADYSNADEYIIVINVNSDEYEVHFKKMEL